MVGAVRISRVRIENFRCLDDVTVEFDDVTTIIGPNGVGKSSILRAMDWFFNGSSSTSMDADDLFVHAESGRIMVEVEFRDLTATDRNRLGKYAPAAVDSVVIWKTWEDGVERVTGKAKAFPLFEAIRQQSGAMPKRNAYKELRESRADLDLPAATSVDQVEANMLAWEREHPEQLVEAEIAGTNLFGFLGTAQLSGLFDFVLVTADLRASEEAKDNRSAVIGRILERTVDRTAVDEGIAALVEAARDEQNQLLATHFEEKLTDLSAELTHAVAQFTTGRDISIHTQQLDFKPQRVQFDVTILDGAAETQIDRQGHGFRRALLLSALKMLAERGRQDNQDGVIFLAIEEPELFQHPSHARSFAAVLRGLADDEDHGVQVAYATHSPLFIEPRRFHQVRRVVRTTSNDGVTSVSVHSASIAKAEERLDGVLSSVQIRRHINGECLRRLSEALFAQAVMLVEGETERATFEGIAARDEPFFKDDVAIAEVGGKQKLLLSRVLLEQFGIASLLVADNDSGLRARMASDGRQESDIARAEADQIQLNRRLLELVGEAADDWPSPGLHGGIYFLEDSLEPTLARHWPAWTAAREQLVLDGDGYNKKHALTYLEAAIIAAEEPPALLSAPIEAVKNLARPAV